MKANLPHEPLVKFGLPASEQDKILQRHATIAAEQRATSNFWFIYTLTLGPILRAAFEKNGKQALDPMPVFVDPVAPALDDLRRSLGLG